MLRYAADRGLVQGLARRPVRRLARRARRVMWCASRAGLQPLPFGSAAAPSRPCSLRPGLHLFLSPFRTASFFSITNRLVLLHLEPHVFPSSAARSRADRLLSFVVPTPRGVGGAPGGALSVRSRLRGATTALARRGPSRATGTAPRGAPTVAIFGPGPTPRHLRQCPPDARRALPAAAPQGPAGGVPNLPRLAVRAAAGGRHSPLRLQDVSGDAPHERGYAVPSIGALRSQYRSRM